MNEFMIKKGFYTDTANRRWEVFYFDKNTKQFRAVLRMDGVKHEKREYLNFDVRGRGTNSKYKLVRAA